MYLLVCDSNALAKARLQHFTSYWFRGKLSESGHCQRQQQSGCGGSDRRHLDELRELKRQVTAADFAASTLLYTTHRNSRHVDAQCHWHPSRTCLGTSSREQVYSVTRYE